MRNGNCIGLLAVFIAFESPAWGADIGTAFTYQGSLEDGSGPVTDTCDFRFGLWRDAASMLPEHQVGTLQTVVGVEVTGGVFTVGPPDIDFGEGAIDGTARWLEIEVQCPGDADFVLLSPRVELSPAPHALALPGLHTMQNYTSPSLIGGSSVNSVEPGTSGASIGGGGMLLFENQVSEDFGAIGGGMANRIRAYSGSIGGGGGLGLSNVVFCDVPNFFGAGEPCGSCFGGADAGKLCFVDGQCQGSDCRPDSARCQSPYVCSENEPGFGNVVYSTVGVVSGGGVGVAGTPDSPDNYGATVGGGLGNIAREDYSIVAGGFDNAALGERATVAGGGGNRAFSAYSTVAGGSGNEAGGQYSFAAGRQARVRSATASADFDGDEGTFVWADSTNTDFASTGPNQFLIRASGGMRLATGDGSTPQFQAIMPSTDTPQDLALNPLGGGVGVGTSSPDSELHVHSGDALCELRITPSGIDQSSQILLSENTTGGFGTVLRHDGDSNRFGIRAVNNFVESADYLTVVRSTGRVGIGTDAPLSQLSVYEDGDSATQTVFTQDIANAGVNIVTDYVAANYTPGLFWSTVNQNASKPKAGIYLQETSLGSKMLFGTSNNYATGITNDALIIDPSGNVGVKRTPAANDLEVEGTASKTVAGDWLANSDAAIKTNVRTITGALAMISRLRPVAFRYNDQYQAAHPSIEDHDYYNYIAQEFREVFPQAVQDDGTGLLQMDAHPAGVYAVAAIQELHEIVQEKDCEIEALRAEKDREIAELRQRTARLEALMTTLVSHNSGGNQ